MIRFIEGIIVGSAVTYLGWSKVLQAFQQLGEIVVDVVNFFMNIAR